MIQKVNPTHLGLSWYHSEPEKIGTEGVIRLLEDLHLDPGSRLVLLLAWKCEAATQCEFTQEEFVIGQCFASHSFEVVLWILKSCSCCLGYLSKERNDESTLFFNALFLVFGTLRRP